VFEDCDLITERRGSRSLIGGTETRQLQELTKRAPELQKAAKSPDDYTPGDRKLFQALDEHVAFDEILRMGCFSSVDEAVRYLMELAPAQMIAYVSAAFVADQKEAFGDAANNLADMVQAAKSERLL
jgi:hypothetical protein